MVIRNISKAFDSSELTNNSYDGQQSGEVEKAAIFTALGLLSFLIIFINCFVLYLISTRHFLRTPTNICLASLSCSDLLAGTCAIPLVISCTEQITAYNAVCLVMDLFNKFQSVSTVLHLLVISLERYITIVSRFRYSSVVKMKNIVIVLCVLWSISLAITLAQLSWVDLSFNLEYSNLQVEIVYDICLCAIVLFSLLAMLFIYCNIFHTLRKQNRSIKRQTPSSEHSKTTRKRREKELRAALILSSMIITFIFGWCGSFLLSLERDLDIKVAIPSWFDYIFLFSRYLTALVNPLLYTFLKLDFIEATAAVFHRFKARNLLVMDRMSSRAEHFNLV